MHAHCYKNRAIGPEFIQCTGYYFPCGGSFITQCIAQIDPERGTIDVDVKFGRIYYVKSMIHWGVSSRLYNFKLDMAVVDGVQGKQEFADVNLQ